MKAQVLITTLAFLKKHTKTPPESGIVEIELIAVKKKVGPGLLRKS